MNNKIVVGHYQDDEVHKEVYDWMISAIGFVESQNIKVARFGDNMRNVGVTEGDKVEAAIQFGWTVDYYGIGDLVEEMDQVSDEAIQSVYEDCQELYEMTPKDNEPDYYEQQVKEQIKIEIGLEKLFRKRRIYCFYDKF